MVTKKRKSIKVRKSSRLANRKQEESTSATRDNAKDELSSDDPADEIEDSEVSFTSDAVFTSNSASSNAEGSDRKAAVNPKENVKPLTLTELEQTLLNPASPTPGLIVVDNASDEDVECDSRLPNTYQNGDKSFKNSLTKESTSLFNDSLLNSASAAKERLSKVDIINKNQSALPFLNFSYKSHDLNNLDDEKNNLEDLIKNATVINVIADGSGYVETRFPENQTIVVDEGKFKMKTKAGIKRNSQLTRSQAKLTSGKVSKPNNANGKETDKSSSNCQKAPANVIVINCNNLTNSSKSPNETKVVSTSENINDNGSLRAPAFKSVNVKGSAPPKQSIPFYNVARSTRSAKNATTPANEDHLNKLSSLVENNILTNDKSSIKLETNINTKTQSPTDEVSLEEEKIDKKELEEEKVDIKITVKQEEVFSIPTVSKNASSSSAAQLSIDMQRLEVRDDRDNSTRRRIVTRQLSNFLERNRRDQLNLSHSIIYDPNDSSADPNEEATEEVTPRRSPRNCKSSSEDVMNEIKRKIASGLEDGIQKQIFDVKGRGVVTTRDFKKGEFVVEYHGELVDAAEAKRREIRYSRNTSIGCYMFYFKHKNAVMCVDATKETPRLGRLLNHSRKGNLKPNVIEIDGKPYIVLYANRDIPAGTELLYDYGDRSKESLNNFTWLKY